MKYAFVERNRRQYGVPALCEALQVSHSGYYAARRRGPSARLQRQIDLTARIRTIHQASRESYGAPRVHVELLAQKVPCCRNTVAKLMRRAEILPKAIRRFRVTTDSRQTKASPNLIHRDFTSARPNDLWLSDITYIPTREGWLCLAAVLLPPQWRLVCCIDQLNPPPKAVKAVPEIGAPKRSFNARAHRRAEQRGVSECGALLGDITHLRVSARAGSAWRPRRCGAASPRSTRAVAC